LAVILLNGFLHAICLYCHFSSDSPSSSIESFSLDCDWQELISHSAVVARPIGLQIAWLARCRRENHFTRCNSPHGRVDEMRKDEFVMSGRPAYHLTIRLLVPSLRCSAFSDLKAFPMSVMTRLNRVIVVCLGCFSNCRSLISVTFESKSKLH
jgi:hypothetical protein